jgi:hypothetical protein
MNQVAGTWFSERGSRLELTVSSTGQMQGTYLRPLEKSPGSFRVVGMVDPANFEGNRCLAFVVMWNNDRVNQHSISTWCGQYRPHGNVEVLDMTWLLTEEAPAEEDWTTTRVGKDTFHREPPSTE